MHLSGTDHSFVSQHEFKLNFFFFLNKIGSFDQIIVKKYVCCFISELLSPILLLMEITS